MPRTSLDLNAVCQPTDLVIDQLVAIVESGSWSHLDAAVAYAVVGGVQLLEERLGGTHAWSALRKRFLVGIDWCRSQPVALSALDALPRSSVRIVDGSLLADRPGCSPSQTYHPKGFLVRRVNKRHTDAYGLLLGSANLSRNGMMGGRELNYWVAAARTGRKKDERAVETLQDVSTWFNRLWRASTPYALVHPTYVGNFAANQSAGAPAVTGDDTAPPSIRARRGLSERDLNLLRSLDNFWIDTGSMYSNLGVRRPGNQLDLKRFSRVFFGFPGRDLEENSAIGSVTILYAGHEHQDRHLRYGDNGMDKLDLPVPGVNAPADYRNLTLHFQRSVGPNGELRFVLNIASHGQRESWRKRSRASGGLFKMGGGSTREFGVY